MLAVQKDVYSAYDHFLAQRVLAACRTRSGNEQMAREAIEILRRWNGQMEGNQAAPMMTELLSREIGQELVQLSVGRSSSKNVPDIRPRPQVIEQLLRDRPRGWVPGDDWDGRLGERFVSALRAGRKEQGSPVANWRWGKMLRWKIEHPVGKQLPLVGGFFDIGPVEMSGSGTSVKQTTAVVGPSERMVVDLGDLDQSVQNLVAGESGFVASAHYKDQWRAYYVGNSFPMEFERVQAKGNLTCQAGKVSTIYTIGHSTRPADEFVTILKAFAIELVADIRTIPRSRHNPQYDQEALKHVLAEHQLGYVHLPALGGLRHARKDSRNSGWKNASFRGYADYMQTAEFAAAIDDLITRAASSRTVIMCAEAVPWRCHRSLVGDALLVRGIQVEDIISEKSAKPHKLTAWARVEGLQISYPEPG